MKPTFPGAQYAFFLLILTLMGVAVLPLLGLGSKSRMARATIVEPVAAVATHTLALDLRGMLTLDGKRIQGTELEEHLKALAKANPMPTLKIRVAGAVPYGEARVLLDKARLAGLLDVRLEASAASKTLTSPRSNP